MAVVWFFISLKFGASSLKVHRTRHTNLKWCGVFLGFFPLRQKKRKKQTKKSPELSSLLVYCSTETNTFYKMKAILQNSLEEITATQGSYYLYSQLHQSLIFIVMVLFLFWCYKNVPCGFSLNNKCAYCKTAWKKSQFRSVLQIKAKEFLYLIASRNDWEIAILREDQKLSFHNFLFPRQSVPCRIDFMPFPVLTTTFILRIGTVIEF